VLTVTPAQIPPTISAIADITLAEDTSSSAIAFTIGDTDTPIGNLSVSATSDNQGVIPAGSIQIGGTGASRTITVTPAADAVGQATITVTVSDGSTTASETFKVTVTPVEDAPTISALSNRTIDEDTVLGPIAVTIGDAETPADQLVLTVSSSNQDVAPSSGITIGGTGAERTLTIVPASNESGSSNITLTVEDQNGQTATRTFTLNVTAVNDRPSITGVANQVLTEDTPSNPILFSVGDAETQASNLTVTASSSDMTLLPPSGLVLSGTGSERTLVITPGANQTGGPAVVTLTVSDGLSTSSRTFEVSVTPVNDAPSISAIANQTGVEDTTLGPIPFTVSDVDSPIGNVVLAASSNNLALVPNSSIVIGGTGENRTLTISPAPNGTGSAVITLTATDGQATSERNFTVSFNPVSDAPVIADIADQTINEDTSSGDITVGLSDADTDVNALTLTATSSNQSVIANGDIVISGSGAKRTIVVTPVANAFGSAVISVTASDGQSSTTETFTVNVVNINDPPSISAIANQTIGKNATWTVPVMVSDIETASGALLVTATSSNQNVIPASNLTLSGTGANRTLQIVSGESVGQSDITVTVSDGTASTATTFTVTVQNAGDTTPPVVTNFVRNDGNDRFNTLTSISITFSEDVSGSLAASDLVITPAGGGAAVDTSSATVAWDANTRTARWNLSGINFPTGFYNVTLPSGAIADGAGNVLDGDGSGNAGGAYSQQVLVALIGDSNLDGIFNTSDLVTIFQIGEYEDTVAGNSTWIEGDWNGDGDFNTSDLVFAFQANTYTAAAVSDVAPDAATTVSVGTDIRQAVLFDQSLELNQRAKSTDDFWANDDAEDVVTDQIWM
ncbi:MAG: tandem-95 repeat protein, partial [Planctomycetales bacterium]|nr:tandem-95 repeat protein [Planctomycetales bacterium]